MIKVDERGHLEIRFEEGETLEEFEEDFRKHFPDATDEEIYRWIHRAGPLTVKEVKKATWVIPGGNKSIKIWS